MENRRQFNSEKLKNSHSNIPIPRYNSQLNSINTKLDPKLIKTEKNQLKLILNKTYNQSITNDINDKESKINIKKRYQLIPIKKDLDYKSLELRREKQLTAQTDKLNVVPSLIHTSEQRVGVNDIDVDGMSEISTSSSSSVSRRRLSQREPNETPHLWSFTGDPPVANQLEHSPNGHDTSANKKITSTSIPKYYSNNSSSIVNERINSNGREFLRLYRPIKNVMEPAKDLQHKTIGHNSEVYPRTSKCYDEDASSEDDIKVDSSSCIESQRLSPLYRGTWPAIKRDTWTSQSISGISGQQASVNSSHNEMASVMSYSSSSGCSTSTPGHRRLGAKVDVVYSLLGMLGNGEGRDDMSATLLAMSNSIDSCLVMRQSGCLPLLVQLIHAPGQDAETRERASQALHNIVIARSDEKIGKREARVLRLLEQLRDYCQLLRISLENERPIDDLERHPGPTIAALMKLSFDEAHRHAMCQLGSLHAVSELIHMDHAAHGSNSEDQSCITLRRYAGMALTNLTFGDGNNKALLCSFRDFMKSLVSQLSSFNDDLRQVTASVLRNLSWRADSSSKQTLREVGAVIGLMKAAMEGKKESTLKSILSALWNLSAHCSTNKVDICAVDGALAFLVDMLSYRAPSKTLSIIENAGGILRNVSSHIAMREDYRAIVRERGCLQVLLQQLRSPSLTVVSNACGALWNLSARCPHDQRLLWDLGAVPMLRSLVHSKHKMISMGSSAALKNLLSARPNGSNLIHLDSTARGLGLSTLPSLSARRQRALEQEIDQNLAETCDNIEPSTSPTTKDGKFSFKVETNLADTNSRSRGAYHTAHGSQIATLTRSNPVPRSESRESMRSVTSTHSDTIFERVNRHVNNNLTPSEIQMKQHSSSLHSAIGFNTNNSLEVNSKTSLLEKKYAMRYKSSIVERLRPDISNDINDLRATTSTMSWATAPDQESTCSIIRSPIDEKLLSPTGSIKSTVKSPTSGFIGKPLVSPTLSHTSETGLFGDYAETDLDEPTNYSLRYAERNSDEDDKQGSGYFPTGEQDIEDTIKTYYTEGTPRETSLNSSRAASHSDLQDEKMKQLLKINQKQLSKRLTLPPSSLVIHSDSEKINNDRTETKINVNPIIENDINTLTVNNKSKIDDLRLKERELKAIRKHNGTIESESFTESMVSDCDDDDEDLLAACIHIGMQNNRHRQSFRRNSLEKGSRGETNLTRYQTSIALDQVESNSSNESTSKHQLDKTELNIKLNHSNIIDDVMVNDKIINDCERANFDNTIIEKFNSIEDNDCMNESISIDNTKVLCESIETPIETASSESMESYDSVERSEHALLQLCIKSGKSKTDNIPIDNTITNNDITDGININDSDISKLELNKHDNNINESKVSSKNKADEYRRQRDPDAMIASLDRLTATLVQQSEAMRERELSTMKQSVQSDTWNEDSPNESFPTITMSVPLIGSFKCELPDDLCQHNKNEYQTNDENNEQLSMTTSCIIEREAFKLADAVNAEFHCNSLSLNDDNIDAIKPPSAMNSLISLSTSYINPDININSLSIDGNNLTTSIPSLRNSRKKSLPIGVIAKRAVSNIVQQQQQIGSLESLLFNDTSIGNVSSQLDNVKPPSMMDDLLMDSGDMENSMISVSSITSEIADTKGTNSLYDIKCNSNAMSACIKYTEANVNNSLSDYLENINPPSLFNEISDIDDTTIDANTDTMCSDTLCIDSDIYSHEINDAIKQIMDDNGDDDDDDDDNDDDMATQIITEYSSGLSSSAESTPKKLNKHRLTVKQKRQWAKERYKTYTISVEMAKKEEEERRKNNEIENLESINRNKYSKLAKLTPKQRRQEDRARFQTQIVENPFGNNIDKLNDSDNIATTSVKSAIPSLKNLSGSQLPNLCNKRIENRERYRTRTLIDSENHSHNHHTDTIKDKHLQTMIEQNVNIVLHTLNESGGSKTDDSILDCETISLVSNDSEAEMSLRMRLGNGTLKNFLTFTRKSSIQSATASQTQESNIKTCESIVTETNDDDGIDVKNEIIDTSESDNDNNECQPVDELPKRPRIIKPPMNREIKSNINSCADKIEQQNSPKGIRGRRKALYSNPNTRRVTPQCPPIKNTNNNSSGIPIGRSNSSPIVRSTRATTLRQNTNGGAIKNDIITKTNNTTTRLMTINKNSTITKRSSIPQRGLTSIPTVKTVKRHSTPSACTPNATTAVTSTNCTKVETPKPLERQGTFTKDEPEVDNAPTVVVESPIKSKIAKPARNSPSKNYSSINSKGKITVRSSQVSQQSHLTKCPSADGITTPKSTSITNKRYSVVENSKTIDNSQCGIKKAINIGQRSNSNSNIVSQNSINGPGKKLTKEATSKIASLWKKVEENRNKQRYEKPDKRQWITATSTTPIETPSVTSNGINSSMNPNNFRLFRSSTFEGVPKQTDIDNKTTFNGSSMTKQMNNKPNYGASYRNSCDLTGMNATEAPCKIPMRLNSDINSGNNSKTTTTNIGYGTIVLRKQRSIDSNDGDQTKRISRLGSFIRVESENNDNDMQISDTIQPSINCNLTKQSQDITMKSSELIMTNVDGDDDDYLTASTQVTTV